MPTVDLVNAAQTQATKGVTDAAAAQADATQAISDASTAQTTATSAQTQATTNASDIASVKTIAEDALPKNANVCLLYTSPSPRDRQKSRMPSSA